MSLVVKIVDIAAGTREIELLLPYFHTVDFIIDIILVGWLMFFILCPVREDFVQFRTGSLVNFNRNKKALCKILFFQLPVSQEYALCDLVGF